MFTVSNDNHSHHTRHKSLLYQLPTKTSTGQLCVRHYIPEIFTKTPECITEKLDTHSFSGFPNYMKNYHIQNYKANCLIEKLLYLQKLRKASINQILFNNMNCFKNLSFITHQKYTVSYYYHFYFHHYYHIIIIIISIFFLSFSSSSYYYHYYYHYCHFHDMLCVLFFL